MYFLTCFVENKDMIYDIYMIKHQRFEFFQLSWFTLHFSFSLVYSGIPLYKTKQAYKCHHVAGAPCKLCLRESLDKRVK